MQNTLCSPGRARKTDSLLLWPGFDSSLGPHPLQLSLSNKTEMPKNSLNQSSEGMIEDKTPASCTRARKMRKEKCVTKADKCG